MSKYMVLKELRSPIKVKKNIYLSDIGFILGYFVVMFMMRGLVSSQLHIPYYICNVIMGFILTSRNKINPGKRFYKCIFIFLQKRKRAYKPTKNLSKIILREKMRNEAKKQSE